MERGPATVRQGPRPKGLITQKIFLRRKSSRRRKLDDGTMIFRRQEE